MNDYCDNGLYWPLLILNLHIMTGIFSLDNIYLVGKTPLLGGDMLVNLGDILPETSKSMLGYRWEFPPNMAVQ